MKPTTEQLINDLRNHTLTSMRDAADRLMELQRELNKALAEVERVRKLWNESHIKERDDFAKEIERVKAECRNQQLNTRPEPSRLEIAAILKAGWFANRDADFNATDETWWIETAQKLINADREVAQ